MKKRNIWTEVMPPLELHEDFRGRIADIFYGDNLNHVAIVDSKKGALRGDHYHTNSVQHMLMTKGAMEYWHKPVGAEGPATCVVIRAGDLVSTPQLEIHALRMLEDENQFIAFATGIRGGKDYEADTIRVKPSIIPQDSAKNS